MNIHPTAIVSPDATIGEGVRIGPYSVIHEDVTIGKNTTIDSHVVIKSQSDIGENCHIYPFCSIGEIPQDLKFKGEKSRVIIGNNNTIREFVTVNRATSADIGSTIIGHNNFLMAYCHVAHNCKLGNYVIMANAAHLAGHIEIEDFAIIGGLTGIHQFTRIGCHAIIGGASAVPKDVPPYVTAAGNHAKLYGLNLIGLRRRGFKEETIESLKKAYRIVFRSRLLLSKAIERVENEIDNVPEVRHFIEFMKKSQRGVCR
jgi:UDP-N-acetylglucosamine acyltransferase